MYANNMWWVPLVLTALTPWLCALGRCWVLPGDGAVVTGVAVLGTRAFLAVPRAWRDPMLHHVVRRRRGPTLLEAPWPEQQLPLQEAKVFPEPSRQIIGRCSCLQSAVGVAVAGIPRLLWVLDSGEGEGEEEGRVPASQCPPKVVVFNLYGKFQETLVQPFTGVPGGAVSGLAVDSFVRDTRAYVGYPGGGGIIVLSLRTRSSWLLRLSDTDAPLLPKVPPFVQAPVWDLALATTSARWPRLLITSRESEDILDLPVSVLRAPAAPLERRLISGRRGTCRSGEWLPAGVLGLRRIGHKLGPGPSVGLLDDPLGGLHYFLVRTSAAVRWDPRQGAGAAGHLVQLQDAHLLPLAEAFFLDEAGSVWAASAFPTPSGNHCVLLQPRDQDQPGAPARPVRPVRPALN